MALREHVSKEKFWRLAFCLLACIVLMGAVTYGTGSYGTFERKYGNIVANDTAVASTATVYSDIFPMGSIVNHGIWCKATSVAGTPIVSYTIEFSPTRTAGDFSELEGGSGTLGVADENPHNDILVGKPSNWGRIRINGVGANPADTLVSIVINGVR